MLETLFICAVILCSEGTHDVTIALRQLETDTQDHATLSSLPPDEVSGLTTENIQQAFKNIQLNDESERREPFESHQDHCWQPEASGTLNANNEHWSHNQSLLSLFHEPSNVKSDSESCSSVSGLQSVFFSNNISETPGISHIDYRGISLRRNHVEPEKDPEKKANTTVITGCISGSCKKDQVKGDNGGDSSSKINLKDQEGQKKFVANNVANNKSEDVTFNVIWDTGSSASGAESPVKELPTNSQSVMETKDNDDSTEYRSEGEHFQNNSEAIFTNDGKLVETTLSPKKTHLGKFEKNYALNKEIAQGLSPAKKSTTAPPKKSSTSTCHSTKEALGEYDTSLNEVRPMNDSVEIESPQSNIEKPQLISHMNNFSSESGFGSSVSKLEQGRDSLVFSKNKKTSKGNKICYTKKTTVKYTAKTSKCTTTPRCTTTSKCTTPKTKRTTTKCSTTKCPTTKKCTTTKKCSTTECTTTECMTTSCPPTMKTIKPCPCRNRVPLHPLKMNQHNTSICSTTCGPCKSIKQKAGPYVARIQYPYHHGPLRPPPLRNTIPPMHRPHPYPSHFKNPHPGYRKYSPYPRIYQRPHMLQSLQSPSSPRLFHPSRTFEMFEPTPPLRSTSQSYIQIQTPEIHKQVVSKHPVLPYRLVPPRRPSIQSHSKPAGEPNMMTSNNHKSLSGSLKQNKLSSTKSKQTDDTGIENRARQMKEQMTDKEDTQKSIDRSDNKTPLDEQQVDEEETEDNTERKKNFKYQRSILINTSSVNDTSTETNQTFTEQRGLVNWFKKSDPLNNSALFSTLQNLNSSVIQLPENRSSLHDINSFCRESNETGSVLAFPQALLIQSDKQIQPSNQINSDYENTFINSFNMINSGIDIASSVPDTTNVQKNIIRNGYKTFDAKQHELYQKNSSVGFSSDLNILSTPFRELYSTELLHAGITDVISYQDEDRHGKYPFVDITGKPLASNPLMLQINDNYTEVISPQEFNAYDNLKQSDTSNGDFILSNTTTIIERPTGADILTDHDSASYGKCGCTDHLSNTRLSFNTYMNVDENSTLSYPRNISDLGTIHTLINIPASKESIHSNLLHSESNMPVFQTDLENNASKEADEQILTTPRILDVDDSSSLMSLLTSQLEGIITEVHEYSLNTPNVSPESPLESILYTPSDILHHLTSESQIFDDIVRFKANSLASSTENIENYDSRIGLRPFTFDVEQFVPKSNKIHSLEIIDNSYLNEAKSKATAGSVSNLLNRIKMFPIDENAFLASIDPSNDSSSSYDAHVNYGKDTNYDTSGRSNDLSHFLITEEFSTISPKSIQYKSGNSCIIIGGSQNSDSLILSSGRCQKCFTNINIILPPMSVNDVDSLSCKEVVRRPELMKVKAKPLTSVKAEAVGLDKAYPVAVGSEEILPIALHIYMVHSALEGSTEDMNIKEYIEYPSVPLPLAKTNYSNVNTVYIHSSTVAGEQYKVNEIKFPVNDKTPSHESGKYMTTERKGMNSESTFKQKNGITKSLEGVTRNPKSGTTEKHDSGSYYVSKKEARAKVTKVIKTLGTQNPMSNNVDQNVTNETLSHYITNKNDLSIIADNRTSQSQNDEPYGWTIVRDISKIITPNKIQAISKVFPLNTPNKSTVEIGVKPIIQTTSPINLLQLTGVSKLETMKIKHSAEASRSNKSLVPQFRNVPKVSKSEVDESITSQLTDVPELAKSKLLPITKVKKLYKSKISQLTVVPKLEKSKILQLREVSKFDKSEVLKAPKLENIEGMNNYDKNRIEINSLLKNGAAQAIIKPVDSNGIVLPYVNDNVTLSPRTTGYTFQEMIKRENTLSTGAYKEEPIVLKKAGKKLQEKRHENDFASIGPILNMSTTFRLPTYIITNRSTYLSSPRINKPSFTMNDEREFSLKRKKRAIYQSNLELKGNQPQNAPAITLETKMTTNNILKMISNTYTVMQRDTQSAFQGHPVFHQSISKVPQEKFSYWHASHLGVLEENQSCFSRQQPQQLKFTSRGRRNSTQEERSISSLTQGTKKVTPQTSRTVLTSHNERTEILISCAPQVALSVHGKKTVVALSVPSKKIDIVMSLIPKITKSSQIEGTTIESLSISDVEMSDHSERNEIEVSSVPEERKLSQNAGVRKATSSVPKETLSVHNEGNEIVTPPISEVTKLFTNIETPVSEETASNSPSSMKDILTHSIDTSVKACKMLLSLIQNIFMNNENSNSSFDDTQCRNKKENRQGEEISSFLLPGTGASEINYPVPCLSFMLHKEGTQSKLHQLNETVTSKSTLPNDHSQNPDVSLCSNILDDEVTANRNTSKKGTSPCHKSNKQRRSDIEFKFKAHSHRTKSQHVTLHHHNRRTTKKLSWHERHHHSLNPIYTSSFASKHNNKSTSPPAIVTKYSSGTETISVHTTEEGKQTLNNQSTQQIQYFSQSSEGAQPRRRLSFPEQIAQYVEYSSQSYKSKTDKWDEDLNSSTAEEFKGSFSNLQQKPDFNLMSINREHESINEPINPLPRYVQPPTDTEMQKQRFYTRIPLLYTRYGIPLRSFIQNQRQQWNVQSYGQQPFFHKQMFVPHYRQNPSSLDLQFQRYVNPQVAMLPYAVNPTQNVVQQYLLRYPNYVMPTVSRLQPALVQTQPFPFRNMVVMQLPQPSVPIQNFKPLISSVVAIRPTLCMITTLATTPTAPTTMTTMPTMTTVTTTTTMTTKTTTTSTKATPTATIITTTPKLSTAVSSTAHTKKPTESEIIATVKPSRFIPSTAVRTSPHVISTTEDLEKLLSLILLRHLSGTQMAQIRPSDTYNVTTTENDDDFFVTEPVQELHITPKILKYMRKEEISTTVTHQPSVRRPHFRNTHKTFMYDPLFPPSSERSKEKTGLHQLYTWEQGMKPDEMLTSLAVEIDIENAVATTTKPPITTAAESTILTTHVITRRGTTLYPRHSTKSYKRHTSTCKKKNHSAWGKLTGFHSRGTGKVRSSTFSNLHSSKQNVMPVEEKYMLKHPSHYSETIVNSTAATTSKIVVTAKSTIHRGLFGLFGIFNKPHTSIETSTLETNKTSKSAPNPSPTNDEQDILELVFGHPMVESTTETFELNLFEKNLRNKRAVNHLLGDKEMYNSTINLKVSSKNDHHPATEDKYYPLSDIIFNDDESDDEATIHSMTEVNNSMIPLEPEIITVTLTSASKTSSQKRKDRSESLSLSTAKLKQQENLLNVKNHIQTVTMSDQSKFSRNLSMGGSNFTKLPSPKAAEYATQSAVDPSMLNHSTTEFTSYPAARTSEHPAMDRSSLPDTIEQLPEELNLHPAVVLHKIMYSEMEMNSSDKTTSTFHYEDEDEDVDEYTIKYLSRRHSTLQGNGSYPGT